MPERSKSPRLAIPSSSDQPIGKQVLDVARGRGVVGELVGVVGAQAQVVGADAQLDVPALALCEPVLEPLLRLSGGHEELHLHLLELAASGR